MIPYREARGIGEWALRGQRVFLPEGEGIRPAAVIVRDGRIHAIRDPNDLPANLPIVEANDHLILPGLVEIHAHINDPGRTEWEGFASATVSAAAGGITTLIDMPLNSSPVTTSVESLRRKQEAARGSIAVDVGFHAGVVPGNADEVGPLIAAGVCAFKAFLCHSGIDDFPNATEADLRTVMPQLAAAGLSLLVHAELVSPLPPEIERRFAEQPTSYAAYLATRPTDWEVAAIRLMIDLCREYRCPVHIVHLAAAEAARSMLAAARAEGLPLTVETCPHYLTFAAEEIPDADPRYKCAPPIRELRQRSILREMVLRGEIDTLGSDHSPAPPELKHLDTGDLKRAWGGIASLQLLLPACWTALGTLERTITALTSRPAEVAGLADRKGSIAPGKDADLVIFDPDAEFVVTPETLHHRHKATPYIGRKLRGVVAATFLRGACIYQQGILEQRTNGQLLTRAAS
ncbi:MAG: allantoinase AllB [Planctomycetes bacterium]|nr:allantoinase AllB [Planctomycetota bacterium]